MVRDLRRLPTTCPSRLGRNLSAGGVTLAATRTGLREHAYPPPRLHLVSATSLRYQLSSKPSTLRTIAPLAMSM